MNPYSNHVVVKKDLTETDEQYAYRCWFVNKQKPETYTDYLEAIKWSKIIINIKYHGCLYNDHVMNMYNRIKECMI